MGYNPQEFLENTINTMGTLLGVHPIVPWHKFWRNSTEYMYETLILHSLDKMILLAWNQTKCLKQFYYLRSSFAMRFLILQDVFFSRQLLEKLPKTILQNIPNWFRILSFRNLYLLIFGYYKMGPY